MSDRASFFLVTLGSLDELIVLYERWGEAVDQHRDDMQVLANQLYRRADEVALARVTLTGKASCGGFIAAYGFLSRKVARHLDKLVLTPDDCRELSQALTALCERVPDEDVLVRRMWRYKLFSEIQPHHVREGWRALRQALEQALALDAGLLWASYEEGAEEKLEEKRRIEQAEREAMAREPDMPAEERERKLRALEDEMRRMKEQGFEMAMAAERERDLTMARTTRRTLYAVPAERVIELRGKRPRARAALARIRAFDALVAEHALERVSFDQPGERGALEALLGVLHIRTFPRGAWAVDSYDAAKVASLERELVEWAGSLRGMHEPVDTVSLLAHDAEHVSCENAYRGLRSLLTRARERGAGLIMTTLVDA